VVSAVTPADDAGAAADRQTVRVNLTLVDDSALGPVVVALGDLGSHIVALQKSEPSLEDVFVELVGRGFTDEDAATTADGPPPGPPSSGVPADEPTIATEERVPAEVA
jgi:hypothetical protein